MKIIMTVLILLGVIFIFAGGSISFEVKHNEVIVPSGKIQGVESYFNTLNLRCYVESAESRPNHQKLTEIDCNKNPQLVM